MKQRPLLNNNIDPDIFLEYYWLKEELVTFCRKYKLSASGSKNEISDRIYLFLKKGIFVKPEKKESTRAIPEPITGSSVIPENIKCDENLRAFFKNQISGNFKFTVPFMNFLKENAGRSLDEVIDLWYNKGYEKKAEKLKAIEPQFEYNTYIRDFFLDNPDLAREDAIKCWNYKKTQPGSRNYNREDLKVLKYN